MKKLIKYSLALALIIFEVYLVLSLVGGNIAEKKEIEKACQLKCAYNSNSYFWEFSGESAVRGFTTKDECFNYCYKKEQGFAAAVKRYGSAFFGAIFLNNSK